VVGRQQAASRVKAMKAQAREIALEIIQSEFELEAANHALNSASSQGMWGTNKTHIMAKHTTMATF
jgi:hypothetical protein